MHLEPARLWSEAFHMSADLAISSASWRCKPDEVRRHQIRQISILMPHGEACDEVGIFSRYIQCLRCGNREINGPLSWRTGGGSVSVLADQFIATGVNRLTLRSVADSSAELSPRCSISFSTMPIPRVMSAQAATLGCTSSNASGS